MEKGDKSQSDLNERVPKVGNEGMQEKKSNIAPSETERNNETRATKPFEGGPRPHRCNPELDDVIQALFEWPIHIREPWNAFVACMRQKESPEDKESPEKKEQ